MSSLRIHTPSGQLNSTPPARLTRANVVKDDTLCLPEGVHLLAFPDSDHATIGIVWAGEMYAFEYRFIGPGYVSPGFHQVAASVFLAPVGAFGEGQLIQVDWLKGHWQCGRCRSHAGLRYQRHCSHAQAAELIHFVRSGRE